MNPVEHCDLAELKAGRFDHLVISASFEERAFGIWAALRCEVPGKHFLCYNENHRSYLDRNVARFKEGDRQIELVPLNSDQPVKSFVALLQMVDTLSAMGGRRIAIDLTAFTRESLAIFIFLAKNKLPRETELIGFYQKAESYGRSSKSGWLSQGVREVRSIIGYAGAMRLDAGTHLILLTGYEFERAQQIIDSVQPNRISIGYVESQNSVSGSINEDLATFRSKLEEFTAGQVCDAFEYSSVDPYLTRDSLLEVIAKSNDNIAMACLNAKPATVGACLAAIERPEVQFIYAQPNCYNIDNYSKPSGKVLYFKIPLGASREAGQ